jgi:hypothetical protein
MDDPLAEVWRRLEEGRIDDATDDDILAFVNHIREHMLRGKKATKDKPEKESIRSLTELLPPKPIASWRR